MKKLLKIGLLSALLAVVMASCNDDDDARVVYTSYATVIFTDNRPVLRTDKGNYLRLTNGADVAPHVEDGDRVLALYFIEGDVVDNSGSVGDYPAYLLSAPKLLCKEPLYQSELNNKPEEDEKVGYDPVRIRNGNWWFGGKYLNVIFDYWRRFGSTDTHFINLVVDDVQGNTGVADDGKVVVWLRHNSIDDKPNMENHQNFTTKTGFVSFDLLPLLGDRTLQAIEEGQLELVLKWTDFKTPFSGETEEHSAEGKFIPWGNTMAAPSETVPGDGSQSESQYD